MFENLEGVEKHVSEFRIHFIDRLGLQGSLLNERSFVDEAKITQHFPCQILRR